MKKESLLVGIASLLVGVGIMWAAATMAVNNDNTDVMKMMGMKTSSSNSNGMMDNDDMSMGEMTDKLQGKTGDDFDKAFIEEMITHHQGAIDMANLAKSNAKHNEIKNMANDIVTAQTKEINDMKAWQVNWGYTTSSSSRHMME